MKRRYWVRHVQETSNAMDIPHGLFTGSSRQIARGLKKSVLASNRTRGTKFQSAMSMLNWFINRGGRGLSPARRKRLERAKIELRRVFGRGRRVSSKRVRTRRR
jgi:hypothetical protein